MDIKLDGIHPTFDGVYELDPATLTNRDYHEIKRITSFPGSPGLRANELQEAYRAGDISLNIAFALIAMRRRGLEVFEEMLWEAKGGSITYIFPPAEPDAVPPAEELPEEETAPPASSGVTSRSSSESPANHPSPTGSPHSETPTPDRESALATSGT